MRKAPLKLPVSGSMLFALRSIRLDNAQSEGHQGLSGTDLFDVARELGLVHTAGAMVKRLPSFKEPGKFEAYLDLAEKALQIQNSAWLEIHDSLSAAGVWAAALKGIFFLNELYAPDERYICSDIDFLIAPRHVDLTKAVLGSLGFSQQFISHDGVVIPVGSDLAARFEERHYELFPFTRVVRLPEFQDRIQSLEKIGVNHPFVVENGELYFALEVDVHHNLSTGLELSDIEDTCIFAVDGRQCLGVSPTVLAWFLPARLYHEVMVLGARKGKLLADIARLVARFHDEIDWEVVAAIADKYTLEPGLLYVYRFLGEWCGTPFPEWLIARLEQSAEGKTGYHDWGDFLPKLLNVRVFFDIEVSKL
jgi:hypothetical protein